MSDTPPTQVALTNTPPFLYNKTMQVVKAYRFKLYPNEYQKQYFLRTAGSCRFVWNYYLNKQKEDYLSGVKSGYRDHSKDLTHLKKTDEYSWLSEVPAVPLQQALRDLDKAYTAFFNKQSQYPKFKSRHRSKPSFRKPTSWKFKGTSLQLATGILVRTRGKLPPAGIKLTSITISQTPKGGWYASIIATEEITPTPKTGEPIGIDLGLTHLAITSDGRKFETKKVSAAQRMQQRGLQQALTRKRKGSNNRAKIKVELARFHEKLKNQRANHLHQTSHQLASETQAVIVVEDLAVKNMVRNHKLARAISEQGWGEFVRQLEYKQLWNGGTLERVDRFFPSSKLCSNCHYIVGKLPLDIRMWTCPKCHTKHDRDINAAKNLVKQWLGNSHVWRQEMVAESLETVRVTRSVKHEDGLTPVGV